MEYNSKNLICSMFHVPCSIKKGFTLIELIVVIAVFLLIVGAAVSIFISIVQHQKIILAEQELLNQTSYVLEYMSKALRMAGKDLTGECLTDTFGTTYPGYNYLLTHYIDGIYTGIKFVNHSDINEITGLPICHEFYLDVDDSNPEYHIAVLKEKKDGLPSSGVALTSDRLLINSVKFGINGKIDFIAGDDMGASGDNSIQPRVTIFLDIQVQGNSDQPSKKIQTTVSQRDLNVQQ